MSALHLRLDQIAKAYTDRVGFTGTRWLVGPIVDAIRDKVSDLRGLENNTTRALVVGACVGADALIAREGMLQGIYVHAIVPYQREQVDPEWERYCNSFTLMPAYSSYRDRNEAIVKTSTRLIAFPAGPEMSTKQRRSGTWMTVGIARKCAVPVEVVRAFSS